MGLFPTPPPTVADLQRQTAVFIENETELGITEYMARHKNAFRYVWENPLGLTPQQVFDFYGNAAVLLFQKSGLTEGYLMQLVPGYEPSHPNQTFVINMDGTVTSPSPVPRNVSASLSESSVSISWDPIPGVGTYHVKKSVSSGSEGMAAVVNTNSYSDLDVQPGATYYYVVSALYSTQVSNGESGDSLEVSITV
jgi:hypothetical protein